MNNDSSSHYRILVLTVWFDEGEDSADPSTWRIGLEDPKNTTRKGCVGVEHLADLLSEQIRGESAVPPQLDNPTE